MSDIPNLSDQRRAWNAWNSNKDAQETVGRVSREQAVVVEGWLRDRPTTTDRQILEVACGTGWMCERLSRFGHVTGTDLADEVVNDAASRLPSVRFVPGDFLELDLGTGCYDVVVALEALSHFVDQPAFLKQIAEQLTPNGLLILATQNRPVMERNIAHLPNHGWYRHWVDKAELRELVQERFEILQLRSITPRYFSGPLHVINSERLERSMARIRLGSVLRAVKRLEEQAGLGWTLMCLARLKSEA